MEPPSVPDSSTARVTIVLEHVVDVKAGADGLADLAERAQLADRGGEVMLALLERPEQLHVLDRERALRRERREDLHRAVVERRQLRSLQPDHADHALCGEHGNAHHRAGAAQVDGLVPLVLSVRQDVVDPDGAALEADASDHRSAGSRHLGAVHQRLVRRRTTDGVREPVTVAGTLPDDADVGAAQAQRVPCHRLEDGLELERPASDDSEHLARRLELVARIRNLTT